MTDAFVDDTLAWEDPRGYDLSDRLWANKAATRSQIDDILRLGIARGQTVAEVAAQLLRFVSPTYATHGGGKARYVATRLAQHETSRSQAVATQQVAMTDPAGGYVRYRTSPSHVGPDPCTAFAARDMGYGRGVYPAKDAPLPPAHIGCKCRAEVVGPNSRDMDAFVAQLRVEYDLADPPDLSPADLAMFRRETAQVRQDVQVMFRAWFEQTGLVSRKSLVDSSPTVREWVRSAWIEKQRRRTQ